MKFLITVVRMRRKLVMRNAVGKVCKAIGKAFGLWFWQHTKETEGIISKIQ